MSSIAEQIVQGDVRALARAATWIENGAPEAAPLLQELSAHLGKALVVGITGKQALWISLREVPSIPTAELDQLLERAEDQKRVVAIR